MKDIYCKSVQHVFRVISVIFASFEKGFLQKVLHVN